MYRNRLEIALSAALIAQGFAATALAGDGCNKCCPPRWSSPSGVLDSPCHYKEYGYPFATCTCDRAYSSPHILGYGTMGFCTGYQQRSCLCPLGCTAGERRWAPAYCDEAGGCGNGACYSNDGTDVDHSNWQVAFAGWESLGHIPNDSAAAAVETPGGAGGSSVLQSLRNNLPLP